jgi:hypothetical protein
VKEVMTGALRMEMLRKRETLPVFLVHDKNEQNGDCQ